MLHIIVQSQAYLLMVAACSFKYQAIAIAIPKQRILLCIFLLEYYIDFDMLALPMHMEISLFSTRLK